MKIKTFKKNSYPDHDYRSVERNYPEYYRNYLNGQVFVSKDYAKGYNKAISDCRKMVKRGNLDF